MPTVVSLLLSIAGVAQAPARFVYSEVHLGVEVRITGYAKDDSTARSAARAAFAEVARLDSMMSDYRPSSDLGEIAKGAPGWVVVGKETIEVVKVALRIAARSRGGFDPTIGPLVALWRESRTTGRLPSSEAIRQAKALTGWRAIDVDEERGVIRLRRPGMRLDLGGVAKGYIIQSALGILADLGVASAMIEAGGDLVVSAAPPGTTGWRIDLATSDERLRRRAGALAHAAVATSGTGNQFVEIGGRRYAHLIDPLTGLGLTDQVTTTVIGADAALADAVATAASVLGTRRGLDLIRRFPAVTGSIEPRSEGRH
ncbi:MAG: FAD:protein FMN transferase [Gemmatimonadetes bacterium]|nr:FAD:protein FMN transferase [Gemmatimonadota bacterium]